MKLCVILPNWVGDMVMCTPTLRALRRRFPGAEVTGVLRPYLADVLAGVGLIDKQIFHHHRSKDRSQRTWPVMRQLRALRPDVTVAMPNSFRSGLLTVASGAKQRVGYVRYGRGFFMNNKLFPPRDGRKYQPTPAIDFLLELAYAVGASHESKQLELATTPADERAADAIWYKLGLPAPSDTVVLNSGGAFGAAKHWPVEHFAELARRIATEQGLGVLVNCGPAERDIAREIVRLARHGRVQSLAEEQVPFGLTKAVIKRSRLLVTTDSGPRFFGVAFGVPTVSLFGPTDPEWSRTDFAGEICLSQPVDCGPCMQRACPLGHHRCMQELSVERVFGAVRRQLAWQKTKAA